MAKYTVVVDLGHNLTGDRGAISLDGTPEFAVNQEVGKYLSELVKPYKDDIRFVFTNLGSKGQMSLSQRAHIANKEMANVFISVHHNSYNGKAKGAESIHSIHGGKGQVLAEIIVDEFNKIGLLTRRVFSKESTKNKGTDYYGLIRMSNMPCVITEAVFMDNKEDWERMDEAHERKAQAKAILKGVLRFFGVEEKKEDQVMDKDNGKVEIEQWKKNILDEAYAKGMFKDYEGWKKKIDEPVPAWAMMAMIMNMMK
jgi:N-acetylmuramoyl-L-alanine amidase